MLQGFSSPTKLETGLSNDYQYFLFDKLEKKLI